jgi:hypothetical protein
VLVADPQAGAPSGFDIDFLAETLRIASDRHPLWLAGFCLSNKPWDDFPHNLVPALVVNSPRSRFLREKQRNPRSSGGKAELGGQENPLGKANATVDTFCPKSQTESRGRMTHSSLRSMMEFRGRMLYPPEMLAALVAADGANWGR